MNALQSSQHLPNWYVGTTGQVARQLTTSADAEEKGKVIFCYDLNALPLYGGGVWGGGSNQ